jgi:hypothetical protein
MYVGVSVSVANIKRVKTTVVGVDGLGMNLVLCSTSQLGVAKHVKPKLQTSVRRLLYPCVDA